MDLSALLLPPQIFFEGGTEAILELSVQLLFKEQVKLLSHTHVCPQFEDGCFQRD
jgi:hypothetical protein